MSVISPVAGQGPGAGDLQRGIGWTGAFWVASGVPALVLFSLGGVAGMTGTVAAGVWTLSILMGFVQSFTYAEIAGLYPNKTGGASVYGAAAWVRYAKVVAPLSVWCNWLGRSPVLALGCSIAAAYILNAVAPIPAFTAASPEVAGYIAAHAGTIPADAVAALTAAATPGLRTWTLFSQSLGPVSISLNATFWIGAALMLITFAIQHRGIMGTANVQMGVGLLVIIPMFVVGLVPLLRGQIQATNFHPLVPLATAGGAAPGHWDVPGWTLMLGGLFIAGWSTYGFETAVCYTSELRNPTADTFKAIFYSGLLCIALYALAPFSFQGVLGLDGMLAQPVVDGSGVADALAGMVGGGQFVHGLLVMMILALMLSVMTAMAGSSRTLYQGSVQGWLPRYLGRLNQHGSPTRAMLTDLCFNLAALAIASADAPSFFLILAVSNCGYIIFNFLNLNAGWIHRLDSAALARARLAAWRRNGAVLRELCLHWRRRQGVEPGGAVGRPDHRRVGHPAVVLAALRPGQGALSGAVTRRARGSNHGPTRRHPALRHAGREGCGPAGLELVLHAVKGVWTRFGRAGLLASPLP